MLKQAFLERFRRKAEAKAAKFVLKQALRDPKVKIALIGTALGLTGIGFGTGYLVGSRRRVKEPVIIPVPVSVYEEQNQKSL